jgi:hypothetical protein
MPYQDGSRNRATIEVAYTLDRRHRPITIDTTIRSGVSFIRGAKGSALVLSRPEFSYNARNALARCNEFGTEGSEVQILSPRPNDRKPRETLAFSLYVGTKPRAAMPSSCSARASPLPRAKRPTARPAEALATSGASRTNGPPAERGPLLRTTASQEAAVNGHSLNSVPPAADFSASPHLTRSTRRWDAVTRT